MKKPLMLLAFLFLFFFSYSQTLFTYGGHPVSTSEFLTAYNKNKTPSSDSAQAMRDYLNLYITFKLKVQAARDLHLDTLPSLKADLQNFRNQIQNGYLKDGPEFNRLVDEAFTRSQKDIHTVFYYLPFSNSHDTATDRKIINEVYTQFRNHAQPEEEFLAAAAKKGVTLQKNDLGFITVFTLPYEFENIIYGLQPGQVSAPYPTKKGWYIFKNSGERPAVGKIVLAQILFGVPAGYSQQKQQVQKTADSVYQVLLKGGDFAELAKQFSDDRTTFSSGGVMPEFGTAKYNSIFESHAFSLKKDGEIQAPFETPFGYHIIKRISATPVPVDKSDETYLYNLKQEVLKDSRIGMAQQQFLVDIKPQVGLKAAAFNKEDLWKITDSSLVANKNISLGKLNENATLFTFNDHTAVKVRDWILYVRNSGKPIQSGNDILYNTLFPEFKNTSSVANYASRLEDFSPEFASQVREFKEGNMLFEIMQQQVWGKASSDSAGLLQYYNQHNNKYTWRRSAEAVIFTCSSQIIADQCKQELRKGKSWKEVVKDFSSSVQADSGRYELGQIPVVDRTLFTNGLITASVINKMDGTAVFSQIGKIYPDQQQRSFEDARGLVVNDYQNYLEQKWEQQLKKKYPVTIIDKNFTALLK